MLTDPPNLSGSGESALEIVTRLRSENAAQAAQIAELQDQLETERLRLAACGTAALGYFDGCSDIYNSASLQDVLRLRKELEALRADAGNYRFLLSRAIYEGSSDWTIEIHGRFATIEEAIDAARAKEKGNG